MNTVELITKKRDGNALSEEEISYLVSKYTDETIPDYQMSAFLMSVYFNGMDEAETVALTRAMRDSGDVVDLSEIVGIKVDKHSTGGVGDKTTLIAGPIAAACGVPVAKMSGRGLGFTGGTVDKMEAIPGFITSMDRGAFIRQVNEVGIAVIGQTGHIAPADKRIYALRDVTATVENLSLITSSIMSKKLAAGSDAILLDVKTGRGAFMKTEKDSIKLAEMMVKIGNESGKRTMAVISDMNQPLGHAVGNALEVREAIDVLKGEGAADITELSLRLAGLMIYLNSEGNSSSVDGGRGVLNENVSRKIREATSKAEEALREGRALDKFREWISAQGGNVAIVDDYSMLPRAHKKIEIKAERNGFVTQVDAMTIGMASQHTGAGRSKKDDEIDMAAGLWLDVKEGDAVKTGQVLCTLFGNDEKKLRACAKEAAKAFKVGDEEPLKRQLIKRIIV